MVNCSQNLSTPKPYPEEGFPNDKGLVIYTGRIAENGIGATASTCCKTRAAQQLSLAPEVDYPVSTAEAMISRACNHKSML